MEGRELETIKGIVQAVVFQNQENGYTVLKLRTDEDIVTVVGCLPGTAPGEGLALEGSWTSHQSYGQQFKAERFQRQAPEGVHAIYEYLASGTIRGIGAKTARLIVSEFGDRTLEILEDFPEELAETILPVHHIFERIVAKSQKKDASHPGFPHHSRFSVQ